METLKEKRKEKIRNQVLLNDVKLKEKNSSHKMKDRKEVLKATEELRESKKAAPAPAKPTQEELLSQILAELQKSNEEKEEKTSKKAKAE